MENETSKIGVEIKNGIKSFCGVTYLVNHDDMFPRSCGIKLVLKAERIFPEIIFYPNIRNSVGFLPVCFLKKFVKLLSLLKPNSNETSEIVRFE